MPRLANARISTKMAGFFHLPEEDVLVVAEEEVSGCLTFLLINESPRI
jgi:hypothetical protein